MKRAARILLPFVVLGAAAYGVWWLVATKPEPVTRPPTQAAGTRVKATRLISQSYEVVLETRGVVRPRTETTLIPEVSGRVIEVSSSFRDGGFFEEGELLLRIDPLDYDTALVIAKSNVAQAATALAEEQVRGEQALENWKRLGKKGEPSDLVLRVPQLNEMEARHKAAVAEEAKAQADLKRTTIQAPYAGRILEQLVDVGQYVSPGAPIAEIFAVDFVEIRLPLTNRQLAFIDLPESFRNDEKIAIEGPEVFLMADLGGKEAVWKGRLVRVEGAIDERSRQLFVVAQVDDPYGKHGDGNPPLKIGLFVDARIAGKSLEKVFVLPRSAVRVGGDVIVIGDDNTISRREVEPLWSDRDSVVIPAEGAGLSAGDVVCLTPLAFPAEGARVLPTIDGVVSEKELTGGGRERSGKGQKPPAASTETSAGGEPKT